MHCGRPARFGVLLASGCKSLMVSQGCAHCGGSQVVGGGADEGVGEGGGGEVLMAAAVEEEVCTEESRGERGPHWLKETSYSL